MDDLLGLWFGFLGIIVGAVITFITEIIIRKGQMKFDMSIEVRETLIELNSKLVNLQNKVLNKHDFCDRNNNKQNIIDLKCYHEDIMDEYKTYRIHLGDLKAYELNSAIYKYYYEKSYHSDNLKNTSYEDYNFSYIALKNCLGLMINEVRFELVKINSLKKISKSNKSYKLKEYLRYSSAIIDWLNNENIYQTIKEFKFENENYHPVYKSLEKIIIRICPFINELNDFKHEYKIPNYILCNHDDLQLN